MQVYGVRFAQELGTMVTARIEELKDNLAGGLSVKNMEDYKHQTGQIKALMEVLAMFSEVETKIDKG